MASRDIMIFNLAEDPGALNNVAGESPERDEELADMLDDSLERLEASASLFKGKEEDLSPDQLEQLRALGYID